MKYLLIVYITMTNGSFEDRQTTIALDSVKLSSHEECTKVAYDYKVLTAEFGRRFEYQCIELKGE